ncbi:MAG: hypothetical protein CHACPFDD_03868 [Phycisphaerae bacterium]|nr:hypothetical protein [Phycisphaerae bacterium]
MFNYDWFHGTGLQRQINESKRRCVVKKFPDADPQNGKGSEESRAYHAALDTRVILYLKDGLSYEMKEMVEIGTNSALSFECVPVDDSYRVGSFIVVVPFEDITRVEVFAVHPDDKPVENLRIPGFRGASNES